MPSRQDSRLVFMFEYELHTNPKKRAKLQVVVRSTRHILSTTLTTVAGFTPLLLQEGGMWPPLAIAIAGGVVGATLLALTFVPGCFLLLRGGTV